MNDAPMDYLHRCIYFTSCEKMYEQKAHHHNYYDDGTHLLRLEYKLYSVKIRGILTKLSKNHDAGYSAAS